MELLMSMITLRGVVNKFKWAWLLFAHTTHPDYIPPSPPPPPHTHQILDTPLVVSTLADFTNSFCTKIMGAPQGAGVGSIA